MLALTSDQVLELGGGLLVADLVVGIVLVLVVRSIVGKVLVLGVVAARIVGRLLERGLRRAGLDDLVQRFGVGEVLEKAKLGSSLSRLIGRAVRLGLTAVVVFAGLRCCGVFVVAPGTPGAVVSGCANACVPNTTGANATTTAR